MATRRRKKTTTKRKRTTKRGMVRRTARKAYAPKKRVARRRRAKKNPDMQPLLYAAAGGAAAGLVQKFLVPMLPGGMVQQYGGPAIQIGLGAYLATSKATQAYKPLGYGMIAVAAANLVSSIMGGMASGQAPVASSGWMPASVVGQRYLSPPTSDIPLNSFLADIVVPA
jgi:hypothetical protein